MRRLLGRESIVLDAVAAANFLVAGIVDVLTLDDRDGPLAGDLAAAVAIAALVLVRRRRPLASAYVLCPLLVFMEIALTGPSDGLVTPFFCLLLFPYAAGAHADHRSIGVPLAFGVAVLAVAIADGEAGLDVFPALVAVAAWMTGRGVRSRTALAAELHEAAITAEEEREVAARRAMTAERRRIAREMHDVVAHSISVMVVQAGGARRIIESDPERAAAAAAEIERTGREALLEMRRLLGVLHGPRDAALLAPAPTFADLEALIERARLAGLPVELKVEGERRPLSAGVDLSAYRVVQEALTNSLKHAPGAPTEVVVRWSPEFLDLQIADRGPGPAKSPSPSRGQGLIGMRERVAMYGGELETGRRRGGGYEVRARFPLESPNEHDTQTPAAVRGAA